MSEFYTIFAQKVFFPGGRGATTAPLPAPSPTPMYHLARSTVDASVSTGTRVKILTASSRVAGLTFAVELPVVVMVVVVGGGGGGGLSRQQLPRLAGCRPPSPADSVVVAALAVAVTRRLLPTVGALELDVTAARVA